MSNDKGDRLRLRLRENWCYGDISIQAEGKSLCSELLSPVFRKKQRGKRVQRNGGKAFSQLDWGEKRDIIA